MGALPPSGKTIDVALDSSLYELMEAHARQAGESLETFIMNRLGDSVEAWTDYRNALSLLQKEEKDCLKLDNG